jgi:hypothetical protein
MRGRCFCWSDFFSPSLWCGSTSLSLAAHFLFTVYLHILLSLAVWVVGSRRGCMSDRCLAVDFVPVFTDFISALLLIH